MKKIVLFLLLSIAVGSVSFTTAQKPKPFAVVELFTSEGCSSCPAADDLLNEMTGMLQKEGMDVIALSFHITYWNKGGWEDPYSQEVFTDRQKKYIQTNIGEQIYTPQAVVNGEKEFIGSNPIAFRSEVTTAVSKTPPIDIKATAHVERDSLVLQYQASKVQSNTVLNVAIVETNIKHFVPRGENKSKTLKHYNVVRSFNIYKIKADSRIALSWPAQLAPSNSSVVVFAQNSKTMRITGATQVKIN